MMPLRRRPGLLAWGTTLGPGAAYLEGHAARRAFMMRRDVLPIPVGRDMGRLCYPEVCAKPLLSRPVSVSFRICPVLQYADDTLLVAKADPIQLLHLKTLLDRFSSSTGLHINFEKSTFVPIGVEP